MVEKKKKAPAKKSGPATKKVATPKKVTPAKKQAKPAEKKGKLVEIQTKETSASVVDFVNRVEDDQKRKDCFTIIEMMKKASGQEAKMWGSAIIGFGNVRYKSPNTGREVDWMKIGFAPRKANISLYLTMDINSYADELKKLGKYKTGKGCLYINRLDDIDVKVLKSLIDTSLKKHKNS